MKLYHYLVTLIEVNHLDGLTGFESKVIYCDATPTAAAKRAIDQEPKSKPGLKWKLGDIKLIQYNV